MRIVCTSDLHGHLPNITPCDLLLIAGDICPVTNHKLPYQESWLKDTFNKWLKKQPATKIIAIWGNHDWIGQEKSNIKYDLLCDFLTDEYYHYDGIIIWGSPWTKEFHDWAFNKSELELAALHNSIAMNTDIILTHGPPYMLCDSNPKGEHCGSKELTKHIINYEPQLVVCGHIHHAAQTRTLGETIIANVAHVDERYRPYLKPQEFEYVDGKIYSVMD